MVSSPHSDKEEAGGDGMPSLPLLSQCVTTEMIPPDFRVEKELGKGSNNRVLLVRWEGTQRVLRMPRRGSDTQQGGSRKWEYLHTLRAAELGVAPRLHAAWYSRHARDGWPSGLYMLMEYFDMDLDTFLRRDRQEEERSSVRAGIVASLQALAAEGMLLFDLKASNVVVRLTEGGGADVRMIDYGRDFCEWSSAASSTEVDVRTPTIDMLHRLVVARGTDAADVLPLVVHVLFATMLVQLASTVGRHMYEDRRELRRGEGARRAANPVSSAAAELIGSMQGRNVDLVREMLRSDEIRSVLRHYHGRRHAGTKRTLAFAAGSEA
jgi:hypothetical protein